MAYTIDARTRALEAASRCGSLREAARVTGISHETIRRWAAAGGRGRLAGVYTGHVGYGKEVDVTGVDERLPKGDEAPESGFEGTPEEQIRQLRLENDILRGMVEVLKGADLGHLTNREKTVLIEWLRRETDHPLRELTDSLGYRRAPMSTSAPPSPAATSTPGCARWWPRSSGPRTAPAATAS